MARTKCSGAERKLPVGWDGQSGESVGKSSQCLAGWDSLLGCCVLWGFLPWAGKMTDSLG